MPLINSPIPSIHITPAPPEKVYPEPYSPIPPVKLDVDEDGYRSRWLSPEPLAITFPRHSSPLRPVGSSPPKGLSRDQFSSLLKVSRDQRTKVEMQGAPDLRKYLALKNQRLKQVERRARFLSKVKDPSFTAAISNSESPLEFQTTAHCSMSPRGFEPDFSAPEVAAENPAVVNLHATLVQGAQVEVAEQPLPSTRFPWAVPKKSPCFPPSLDDIAARLKPMHASFKRDCSPSRLPNFLTALTLSPVSSGGRKAKTVPTQYSDPCALQLGLRRLVIPHTVDIAV